MRGKITFYGELDQWKRFNEITKKNHRNRSQVINQFIENYNENNGVVVWNLK